MEDELRMVFCEPQNNSTIILSVLRYYRKMGGELQDINDAIKPKKTLNRNKNEGGEVVKKTEDWVEKKGNKK